MKELLINTALSDEEMKKLRSREDPAFPYLFAIVGDISVKSEYCRNVLLVSEKKIDTYEIDTDHFGRSVALDEVESAQNKRMYGNALLRLKLKSGETVNIFRYTFSVNALSEAAAGFIGTVSSGGNVDEAYDCMKAVYEKQLSVCPKCGSKNLTKIDRMNGYLSYSRVHGESRLNDAKMAEIAERKSM